MSEELFDEEDDFDEEAEASERYPFLFDEEADNSDAAHENKSDSDGQTDVSPNYHYIHRLTDELLPTLDFYRFDNLFEARPARGFFEKEVAPRSKRLFSNHWRFGEIAILFGDTGTGKSILAAQIAQAIASGFQFGPFELDLPSQRVVYFDLEFSRAQFENRYSSDDEAQPAQFPFHLNFIRCSPRPEGEVLPNFRDYTEWLTSSMVEFIEFSEAKVVIIDNITWLNNSSQIGNSATRVMKALQNLKRRLGISILVIAHTPKRPVHSALDINDLQGSIMLANFADSLFALGSSRAGFDIRYLKPIKHRTSAARESSSEVSVIRLFKDQCFLGFEFVGTEDESEHTVSLKGFGGAEPRRLLKKIMRLHEKGWTQRRISETTGVSAATVNRIINSNKGNRVGET